MTQTDLELERAISNYELVASPPSVETFNRIVDCLRRNFCLSALAVIYSQVHDDPVLGKQIEEALLAGVEQFSVLLREPEIAAKKPCERHIPCLVLPGSSMELPENVRAKIMELDERERSYYGFTHLDLILPDASAGFAIFSGNQLISMLPELRPFIFSERYGLLDRRGSLRSCLRDLLHYYLVPEQILLDIAHDCGVLGLILDLAKQLQREELSGETKSVIEQALLIGIETCAHNYLTSPYRSNELFDHSLVLARTSRFYCPTDVAKLLGMDIPSKVTERAREAIFKVNYLDGSGQGQTLLIPALKYVIQRQKQEINSTGDGVLSKPESRFARGPDARLSSSTTKKIRS